MPRSAKNPLLKKSATQNERDFRVDHVPTMAGEDNENPGYCSLGRLYAIGYLKGLMEMAGKE